MIAFCFSFFFRLFDFVCVFLSERERERYPIENIYVLDGMLVQVPLDSIIWLISSSSSLFSLFFRLAVFLLLISVC